MTGRPRKQGARYPSGGLRPERHGDCIRRETVVGPLLTAVEQAALEHYQRDLERVITARSGMERATAAEALRSAYGAITNPRTQAFWTMAVHSARPLPMLAERSGRPQAELEGLFKAACGQLAAHYEVGT